MTYGLPSESEENFHDIVCFSKLIEGEKSLKIDLKKLLLLEFVLYIWPNNQRNEIKFGKHQMWLYIQNYILFDKLYSKIQTI